LNPAGGTISGRTPFDLSLVRAGRSRDLRTEVFGQLDDDGADAARAGMDQDLWDRSGRGSSIISIGAL
jgi:hypothetical protein